LGGNIILSLGHLALLNGGQITTSSEGSGSAGDIYINATDGALISGSDPTFAARLALDPGVTFFFIPTPQSTLSVRSAGLGAAGNIIIGDLNTTPELVLDGGQIIAESAAVDGGNINLNLGNLLLLRNSSLISATAGTAQSGGNGGSISIDIDNGFVVTVPNENNDIIANAFAGSGGQVNLTAQRILGFTPQDGFNTAQLRSNTSSDLSASSQLGTQGTVAILNLAIDPSQALAELPVTFSDVTNQIAQGCRVNPATAQSQFVITGRGGLPPSPSDPLASEPSDFPWATRELSSADGEPTATMPEVSLASPALVEAQGWVREANGDIVFVVAPSTASQPSTDLAVAGACPSPTVLE
jgi:large exoprotein involved in heme utilization and adhesion